MSDSNAANPRSVDGVRISEINTILKEEGYFTPEPLSPDLTFGQVRGIAGRRYTQLLKRLGDLGFTEASSAGGVVAIQGGGVQVHCYFVYLLGIPILVCEVKIWIGPSTI